MNRAQEKREFRIFIDGLREYMKRNGRFAGKPIAPNWHNLSEQEQDHHIDLIFVTHVERIAHIAHDAIHKAH